MKTYFFLSGERFLYPVGIPGSGAAVLAVYGAALRDRPSVAAAGLAALGAAAFGWRGYRELRQEVAGLDFLVLSLALLTAWTRSRGRSPFPDRWDDRRRTRRRRRGALGGAVGSRRTVVPGRRAG